MFELWLLGFSVGASFGPVNIIVMKAFLLENYKNSFYVLSGALLGDALLLLISIILIDKLSNLNLLDNNLYLFINGIVLIFISVLPFFQIQKKRKHLGFISTLIVTLLNPLSLILWFSISNYFIVNSYNYILLYTIIIFGDVSWFLLFVGMLIFLKKHITQKQQLLISTTSNIIIIWYGLKMIILSFH